MNLNNQRKPRRRRWLRYLFGILLLAWASYKVTTTRAVGAGLSPPTRNWQDDPNLVADMSQFTPGALPIRAQRWDTGRGLAGYVWQAPHPRAVLLFQAGWGDYALRYVNHGNRLIPHLLNIGISVYAFDMWGAGYSPGSRGATSVAESVEDHLAARRKLGEQPLPVFLAGHSMGGLVTVTSALQDQRNLRGIVLLAPGLKYATTPVTRGLVGSLGFLFPTVHAPFPEGKPEELTKDPAEARGLAQDPVLNKEAIKWTTVGTGATVSQANFAHYPELKVPILVIHGTKDIATDINGSRECINLAASPDKTFYPVPGGYHSILDDANPMRDQALDATLSWLKQRL